MPSSKAPAGNGELKSSGKEFGPHQKGRFIDGIPLHDENICHLSFPEQFLKSLSTWFQKQFGGIGNRPPVTPVLTEGW